jgi:hypothetical protein
MASLILEEIERENKDRKTPTIIGMLDAKSVFDVVHRSALKVPSCRSPCSILNSSDSWPFHLILVVAFLYRLSINNIE